MKTRDRRSVPVVAVVLAVAAALVCGVAGARAQPPTPSVTPINISPALPADDDAIVVSADVLVPAAASAGPVSVQGGQITLYVNAPQLSPAPPGGRALLQWQLPALPAGSYNLSISLIDVPSMGFVVRPRAALLGLGGSRFQVSVVDQQPGASPAAVQLSDSAGYFTFFGSANVELTIKIVDGRAVNGHFWIFVASMTDTPLTLTVTDTQAGNCASSNTCPTRTYTNPPHTNQNFIDINAF